MLWAPHAVAIDRASIARTAAELGWSCHTVNHAVLAAGRQLLIGDPTRLDGVRMLRRLDSPDTCRWTSGR